MEWIENEGPKKTLMLEERLLPIFLDVKGRSCLLLGGGPMVAIKAAELLECGGRVHVVSPSVVPEIIRMANDGRLRWSGRRPEPSDIAEAFLIFASDETVGTETPICYRDLEEYRRMADETGRLFNAMDHREICHFTNPSVARKAPLVVAISTGGNAPVLGQYLRDRVVNEVLTEEFVAFARFVGRYRKRLRTLIPDYPARKAFYRELLDSNFLAFLRERNEEEALSELIRRVAETRKEQGERTSGSSSVGPSSVSATGA